MTKATSGSTRKGEPSSWIGARPEDPSPILYFSGCRRWTKLGLGEADLYRDVGWRHRCFSYFYLNGPSIGRDDVEAWAFCLHRKDVRVFLDSGAHTFLTTLKGDMTEAKLQGYLEDFAAYAKPLEGRFDFVVNFDYIKRAPIIYKVLHRLRDLGLRPIPVYHGDSSLDWIRRYHDEGYKLIGLGKPGHFRGGGKWIRRRFYESVFDLTEKLGLRCHGFAVTGANLFHYPWHSLDSASWLRAAVRGAILHYVLDQRKLELYHVAQEDGSKPHRRETIYRLNPDTLAELKTRTERLGIPFKKLQQSGYWRAVYNAKAQMEAVAKRKAPTLGMRAWQPVL